MCIVIKHGETTIIFEELLSNSMERSIKRSMSQKSSLQMGSVVIKSMRMSSVKSHSEQLKHQNQSLLVDRGSNGGVSGEDACLIE